MPKGIGYLQRYHQRETFLYEKNMNHKRLAILYQLTSSLLLVAVIVFLTIHIKSESKLSDLENRIIELENDLKNTKEVLDSHGFEDLNL